MNIAIDGPAASGKSTVARRVAQRLRLVYLDTGAMYRAVTYLVLREAIDPTDESAIVRLMDEYSIESHDTRTFVDGVDISSEIRKPRITELVSIVCRHSKVRERMVVLQRKLAECGGVVMEGRDIGTVVLPDAELKIFLTASLRERARRRQQDGKVPELTKLSIEEIAQQLAARDSLDSTREVAPLRKAPEAIELDTTSLSIDEVVDKICDMAKDIEATINISGGAVR